MLNVDLYELIFEVFLGLDRCMGRSPGFGCITGEITHDLIYSLFIPHVVLLVFLTMVFKGVSNATGDFGGAWLEVLLIVSGYLWVVGFGFYPFFSQLASYWILIAILGGLFYFFTSRIFGSGSNRGRISRGIGKKIGKSYKRSLQTSIRKNKLDQFIERLYDDLNREMDPDEREKTMKALEIAKRERRRRR